MLWNLLINLTCIIQGIDEKLISSLICTIWLLLQCRISPTVHADIMVTKHGDMSSV